MSCSLSNEHDMIFILPIGIGGRFAEITTLVTYMCTRVRRGLLTSQSTFTHTYIIL